ncbi:MAG: sialate O-acetylesterase [Bacteroidales bacterium]
MKKLITIATLCLGLNLVSGSLSGQVTLPSLISDSMIIQRNAEVRIWGWAPAGETVRVSFNGRRYRAQTGAEGSWEVTLPPMEAGGPYTMEISGGNRIEIGNILVGDVWLCSGQSNMVHYMELHNERYADEIAEADYPDVRQFLIPTTPNLEGPQEELPPAAWKSANPEDVKRFSVVAYFFALKLHSTYGIPIGIINASVGGTPIEAWTSEEGLQAFPDLEATIEKNRDTAYVNSTNRASRTDMQEIYASRGQDSGMEGPVKWYDSAYQPANWLPIYIPGYWEDQGVRNLDGVVWYRREIEVPTSMTGVPAKVALGRIIDADRLYINGTEVGHTTYQYPQRRYQVPAGVLKPGKNLLVVRVENNFGKGGFVPDKPYYLTAAGDTLLLSGKWDYRVGLVYRHDRFPRMGISAQNQPSALYNGMIAPLTDFAIRGFVWYQGESNASRPDQYRELMPALIHDWRGQWGEGTLPFLYVQLPNYMEVNYLPEESNWAKLREAQLEALKVPQTGMAVAIDLGEWNDIHPDNKKPVGDRLALAAEKVAYGEEGLVWSGPLYRSSQIDGGRIIITFDHVGSGLVSGNGEKLGHFAIAGADKKFRWGHAEIQDNNTVVVWSEEVPEPRYVRYAWADNPEFANLYNKEGLPASPFRTDQ